MGRGKYQTKGRPFPFVTVAVIALLVASLSVGGIVGHLAMSTSNGVKNTFETAPAPNPQVVYEGGKYYIDVGNPGYTVYVRAAVVPNWVYGNEVVPASPDSFGYTAGTDWVLHADGFFYYTKPIASGRTGPIFTAVTAGTNPGGVLTVDIAVQVIQALGTKDEPEGRTAVVDAWGVQPENLA